MNLIQPIIISAIFAKAKKNRPTHIEAARLDS